MRAAQCAAATLTLTTAPSDPPPPQPLGLALGLASAAITWRRRLEAEVVKMIEVVPGITCQARTSKYDEPAAHHHSGVETARRRHRSGKVW